MVAGRIAPAAALPRDAHHHRYGGDADDVPSALPAAVAAAPVVAAARCGAADSRGAAGAAADADRAAVGPAGHVAPAVVAAAVSRRPAAALRGGEDVPPSARGPSSARTPGPCAPCTCGTARPVSRGDHPGRSRGSASIPRDRFVCRNCRECFWGAAWRIGRALYTSAVDRNDEGERRKTLRTLIDLAEGSRPADCWDDLRAEDLLRSQTTAEEARELGMSPGLIERVFGTPSESPSPRSTINDQ